MMKVKSFVNDRGDYCKEDRIGFDDAFAFVIDGATSLSANHIIGYSSDAVWFVEKTKAFIEERLAEDPEIDNQQLFNQLAHQLNTTMATTIKLDQKKAEDLPSAAFIMARKIKETLNIISFGDCTAVVEYHDGDYQVIHDERTTNLDRDIVKQMLALQKDTNIPLMKAKQQLKNKLKENRQLRNKPNGYVALDMTNDYIGQGLEVKIDYHLVKYVYLFSDGFESYYTNFSLGEDAIDLVKKVKARGGHRVLDELRMKEESDIDCESFPRLKGKDDASLIMIDCST